ncbi:MAG: peptidoglycan DD-metalloendopeptidase family protein, partial [Minisyncoccia bacterium]
MRNRQGGFAHVELVVILIVILVVALAGGAVYRKSHKNHSASSQSNTAAQAQKDEPLPLKSISFDLDYYNASTNHAGDMVFTHEDHDLSGHFHDIFSDFGTQDPRSPNDPTKRNPQPTFVLPLGTKVHSLVDGVVVDVKDLYSNDQTIWVSQSSSNKYIYETEHIINPLVKKGDRVTGGQIIGEVSTHDSQYHPGFGIVEIGILYTKENYAQHLCPFHYLDPSIKNDIDKKILDVHQAWMKYTGLT